MDRERDERASFHSLIEKETTVFQKLVNKKEICFTQRNKKNRCIFF